MIFNIGSTPALAVPILDSSYPQNTTVTNGTSATFGVIIATDGYPDSYTYQWYVDGTAVSGATDSTYTRNTSSDKGVYSVYCIVENEAGTVQSRTATLTVNKLPVLNSSYPQNTTVAVDHNFSAKVAISSAGYPDSYTYQWYCDNKAISGATSATLNHAISVVANHSIYCKVTNAAGTVQSKTATITVTPFYLYNAGNEYTDDTGGWKSYAVPRTSESSSSARTLTKGSNSMSVAGESSKSCMVRTVNKVKITSGMKTLEFSGTLYSPNENGYAFWSSICVWSAIGSTTQDNVVASFHQGKGTFSGTKSIDVSSLNGTYYVGFAVHGTATFSVTSLQLK